MSLALRSPAMRGGFSGKPRTGSAAVVTASGGNVVRGGGCVGTSTQEVPPAWMPVSLRSRRYAGGGFSLP